MPLPPREQRELTQIELELSSDPTLAALSRRLGRMPPARRYRHSGQPRTRRIPGTDVRSAVVPTGAGTGGKFRLRKHHSWKSLTAAAVLVSLIVLAVITGLLEPAALPAVIIAIVATTLVCAAAGGVWANSDTPVDRTHRR